MKHVGLVILASLALLFVSCGSKIQGKYVYSVFGGEICSFTFKGTNVTFVSLEEEKEGSFTFDSKSNIIHIEWNNGKTQDLTYNPSTKNITEKGDDMSWVYKKK